MKTTIISRTTAQDIISFYMVSGSRKYYLFSQTYSGCVHAYYRNGVSLDEALDFSRAGKKDKVLHTMEKLPLYIRYIEKEEGISVLRRSKKTGTKKRFLPVLMSEGKYMLPDAA